MTNPMVKIELHAETWHAVTKQIDGRALTEAQKELVRNAYNHIADAWTDAMIKEHERMHALAERKHKLAAWNAAADHCIKKGTE